MRFKNLTITPALIFLLSTLAVLAVPASGKNVFDGPWPLLPKDTPAQPGEVWGELSNGLRYVVIPTEAPGNAVSMRLLVGTGRAQEPQGKSGLAILVSDLMFMGTEGFGRDEIVSFALENGINPQAGSLTDVELNHSEFRLDLEEPVAGALEKGIKLLGDIAGRARFEQEPFEATRSYIAHRASFGLSLYSPKTADFFDVLYRSSPYSDFNDKQVAEGVKGATLDDARAYWSSWYKPNRMVLIVTGAVDSTAVEGLVGEEFGELVASSDSPVLKPVVGKYRDKGSIETETILGGFTRLSIGHVYEGQDLYDPAVEERFYVSDFLGRYAQSLASDAKHLGGRAAVPYGKSFAMLVSRTGSVITLQEQLIAADKAIHRLEEFGVRSQDLDTAKTDYLSLRSDFDVMLSSRALASLVADRAVRSVLDRLPFRYGPALGEYVERVISPLSTEAVKETCGELFNVKDLVVLVEIPDGIGLTAKVISKRLKTVRKTYDFTWERAGEVKQNWDVGGEFQSTGMVESTELARFDDYPVLQYAFSNNLRLNLIQTDAFPNRLQMQVSMGNGMSSLERVNPAFKGVVRSMMFKSKVGNGVQAPTMGEMLESKGLEEIDAGLNLDQLYWSAQGRNEEDVTEFMSAIVLWLVTSRMEEDTYDSEIERITNAAENGLFKSPLAKTDELLFSQDDRMRSYFDPEDLEALSFEALGEWLFKTRETAYIEVTVAGNLAPRSLLRDVRKTFGSIPVRTGKVMQPRHGAVAIWPEAGVVSDTFEQSSNSGYVTLLFPQVDKKSCENDMRLSVFQSLLAEHMVRALDTYPELRDSLEVSVIGERMVPVSNALKIQVRCKPEMADTAREILLAACESFPESLTAELVAAAERKVWIDLKRVSRDPKQLVTVFSQSQGKPNDFGCLLGVFGKGMAYGLDVYQSVAARQFSEDNVRGAIVMPK